MNQSSFSKTKKIINISAKITLTSSSLSIIGVYLVIYTYMKIPHLRQSTPRKLLVNITIADLLSILFYFVGALRSIDLYGDTDDATKAAPNLHSDILCRVQSVFTSYGSVASFFWTDILAIYLFVVVRCQASTDLSARKRLLINFFGWFLPAFIVLAALLNGVLGEDTQHTSGPWCWIEMSANRTLNKIWLFLNGKAYELLTYGITFVLFIWMKIAIRRTNDDQMSRLEGQPGLINSDEKFWLTWIVLLVLRLPGTIRTFIFLSGTRYPDVDKYLLYFQSFGDVGQAFVNSIIYCVFDYDVIDFFRDGFTEYINELRHGIAHINPPTLQIIT